MAKTTKSSDHKATRKSSAEKRKPTPKGSRTRKKEGGPAQTIGPAGTKRQEYAEAVALYERALKALQGGQYAAAAPLFEELIAEFPEERELHERSRRYLEICQRQTAPPPTPRTTEEKVYAATLALNAGRIDEALEHLTNALEEAPRSDHVHYMLAVVHAARGESATALTHLRQAIDLNPDNRFAARHESGFDALKHDEAFQHALAAAKQRIGSE